MTTPQTATPPKTVMGIDPGTRNTGYGVIENGAQPVPIEHGVLRMKQSLPLEERLHGIHVQLLEVIDRIQPDIIAVEEPFFGKGARSSMAIGQAQALALISAASRRIPLRKYSPATVKVQVTNNGRATKEEVRTLVAAQLSLTDLEHLDAADALAVALCCISRHQAEQVLNESKKNEKRPGAASSRRTN